MSITQISDFTLRHMIENDKRDKEFQQKQIDRIRQLETELADKDKQLAGAQELIKKLRRCANCKHRVEYVLFGEVATACALEVNEEENQTCKNFDKWESEQ